MSRYVPADKWLEDAIFLAMFNFDNVYIDLFLRDDDYYAAKNPRYSDPGAILCEPGEPGKLLALMDFWFNAECDTLTPAALELINFAGTAIVVHDNYVCQKCEDWVYLPDLFIRHGASGRVLSHRLAGQIGLCSGPVLPHDGACAAG